MRATPAKKMEDPLAALNDRSLPFPDRCKLALSFLSTHSNADAFFPRRNQVLFDWLAGSLLKQAKGEAPRAEVFLAPEVWSLFEVFLQTLTQTPSKKRRIDDYIKCFDASALVIKVPLLFVFQVTLQLLSSPADDLIEQVILGFLSQNRSSLPVSLSQMVDFIKVLTSKRHNLRRFPELLQICLSIFSQIIASGAANYKKSYPSILQFALSTHIESEEALWIDCWQRCLFPEVDELLTMLKSDTLAKLLKNPDCSVEGAFPKTASIQKLLFVQFSQLSSCAPLTLSTIYEAFLRSAGTKIDRQSGFNLVAFLIARCPVVQGNSSALAALLSVLHARGNEIYQQRNDEIYHAQSEIIQNIFEAALKEQSYLLLLQVARLNYYLVLDKFSAQIRSRLDESREAKEFLVGMFELAAQANQMPSFVASFCDAREILVLNDAKLQSSLAALFARSIPLAALQSIFTQLSPCDSPVKRALIRPVLKNVYRLLDARLLPRPQFCQLQQRLLEGKHFELLTFLVRWTPTHVDLAQVLFEKQQLIAMPLPLCLALKFKNPPRLSLQNKLKECAGDEAEDLQLIVDYLPAIASECPESLLKSTAKWLIQKQPTQLLKLLKNPLFFEIEAFRKPFLARCCKDHACQFISLLPAEYFDDGEAVKLATSALQSPAVDDSVMRATLLSGHHLRSTVLQKLLDDSKEFLGFLLHRSESDLLSKCVEADAKQDGKLLKLLLKEESLTLPQLARALKYTTSANFNSSSVQRKVKRCLEHFKDTQHFDDLEVVLEWFPTGEAAKLIPEFAIGNQVRLMALQLRFCPLSADAIPTALSLLPHCSHPADKLALRRGLLVALKQPSSHLPRDLDYLLADPETYLQAVPQLLSLPPHSLPAFTHFFAHFQGIPETSGSLLPVLKSACQLKKGVEWTPQLLARILGTLRSRLCSEGPEVCAILKILIAQHWKLLKSLAVVLVSLLMECLQLPGLTVALSRVLHELAALRLGQVDAFTLLPFLAAFVRSPSASRCRALQLAMSNLLRHFGPQPQLFQLLASAMIGGEEERLVLRGFLDEYRKFYKYTGRA